jgi:YjbE family integral membrane protein
MEILGTSFFWVTLGQIIMINILLSGDNAVVIALASRSLPPQQQKQAILFGSIGAIVLRIVLTFFAVALLTLPFLKIVGALLLIWIGIKMLVQNEEETQLDAHSNLIAAIKTIIVADFVMSLDNVIGVAAAAKGNTLLLVIGLAISIPLIIYGSTLVLKLMNRFGFIVVAGAGLLGWVAGEMLVTDPILHLWVPNEGHWAHTGAPILAAAIVVLTGSWLSREGNDSTALAAVAAGTGEILPHAMPAAERPAQSPAGRVHDFHLSNAHVMAEARPLQAIAPTSAFPQSLDGGAAPGLDESLKEPPPGYRWVSSAWRTQPDGRRDYAAYHGEKAFRTLAPVSSHLRSWRRPRSAR